jgi:uncharacterized protein (TIRG00374 family)
MQSPGPRLLNETQAAANRKGKIKWFARLMLGILVVGILVRWQGDNVGNALRSTSPLTLVLAVFAYLSTQFISALRWRLLLNAAVQAHNSPNLAPLGVWESYRLYLIGMFCNLWLPTAIGGDAVRAAMATKHSGNLALAVTSIFVERLTGLAALLAIGMIGMIAYFGTRSSGGQSGQAQAMTLAGIAIAVLVVMVIFIWLLRKIALRISTGDSNSKLAQKFVGVHQAFDVYFTSATRPALIGALALSLLFQGSHIVLNIFLDRAVGLNLPAQIYIWLIPSLGIASMIPLGVGGLGVREAGAVAFLNGALPAGAMPEPGTIIAWSLLWQAMLWISGLPGALAYFGSGFKGGKATAPPPDPTN